MYYRQILFPILVLFALISCSDQEQIQEINPSISAEILTGGSIITMEPTQPSAQAVVIDGTTIEFVGSLEQAQRIFPNGKIHQLKGKTLMPGFLEQHLHPVLAAIALNMPVIAPEAWKLPSKTWPAATDPEEYYQLLKAEESIMPNDNSTLWSWGFNQFFHGEISKQLLDTISDTRPILIWHRSAHEMYLNSAAIAKYNITLEDIAPFGKSVADQINLDKGHFYESGAFVYLFSKITPDLASPQRLATGLVQMVELLHSRGVTGYMEPGAYIPAGAEPLYEKVLADPATPMYSFFIPSSLAPFLKYGKEKVVFGAEESTKVFPNTGKMRFLDKQIKILADGAIISQLMQMSEGYLDGHHGEWVQTPEDQETISKAFWDAGYQIHVHVNGDAGLDYVLDTFARRMEENPRQDHRGVIVHFANSRHDQIKRIKDLGLIVSANPYYVTGFSEKFSEIGLGKERAESMVRLAPLESQGTSVSLHSDLPMAPADPLYLAWSAVTRESNSQNIIQPELGLSVDAAMRAITIETAYSWQMEDEIGSIKVGKKANFTVLEKNPYKVQPKHIKDIKVMGTIFEGVHFPIKSSK